MRNSDREQALLDLILLQAPTASSIERLRAHPWDSAAPLVTLTRADAVRALDAYVRGSLDADTLEERANAIEGRDDIGFEAGSESLLRDFTFHMANPALTSALSHQVADDWKRRMG